MAEELTLTEISQGIGSMIYVFFTFAIGIIFFLRYLKHKNITILEVGIAWAGMCIPWLGDVINFFLYLGNAPYLSDFQYLIIVNAFLPIFVISWLAALTELLNFKQRKLILLITVILNVVFEIIFFILIIADTKNIGTQVTPFQYEFSLFTDLYMIIIILVVLLTGLRFAFASLRAEDPAIKLKGKFLIVAFILFTLGAVMDSQLEEMTQITVVIVRIILASSSFIFYLGFILPDWAKKIFLKQK